MNLKKLNTNALIAWLDLSRAHPDYKFYVTDINAFADNLPQCCTVLERDDNPRVLKTLSNFYKELLNARYGNNYPPEYTGMDFVPYDYFNKDWFTSGAYAFTIKDCNISVPKRYKVI